MLRERYVSPGVPLIHPLVLERGENEYLFDSEGRRYLDFTSGIGVTTLGHVNPELVEAAVEQLRKLWHVCIHVASYPPYLELAERLSEAVSISGEKMAVFFNSGAEAVENAVKIARQVSGKPYTVSFIGGFHGRTILALSLTGKYKPYKLGFEPLAPSVVHAPYPYCYRMPVRSEEECAQTALYVLEQTLDVDLAGEVVAAIVVEPMQGEGGFIVPPKEFMRGVEKAARSRGIYLVLDEVQTGYCRTGRFMAFEHFGIDPDMVTLGKAIANGLPLSAVVGRRSILGRLKPGSIGGTYTGNPVSAAVAGKVLEIMKRENICRRAEALGKIMAERLNEMASKYMVVGDHRGLGVMRAIEIVRDKGSKKPEPRLTSRIIEEARNNGLLLLKAGYYGNVIRLHPPLTISEENLVKGLDILEEALRRSI